MNFGEVPLPTHSGTIVLSAFRVQGCTKKRISKKNLLRKIDENPDSSGGWVPYEREIKGSGTAESETTTTSARGTSQAPIWPTWEQKISTHTHTTQGPRQKGEKNETTYQRHQSGTGRIISCLAKIVQLWIEKPLYSGKPPHVLYRTSYSYSGRVDRENLLYEVHAYSYNSSLSREGARVKIIRRRLLVLFT